VTCVRVIVSGRVQGVFFRASCAQEARTRGLAGWVRNRPDGAVEAVFEGTEAQVEAMVAWCRLGPPSARVDAVSVETARPTGTVGFEVVG
jgi:acylphosphatase